MTMINKAIRVSGGQLLTWCDLLVNTVLSVDGCHNKWLLRFVNEFPQSIQMGILEIQSAAKFDDVVHATHLKIG